MSQGRILIADDTALFRAMLRDALEGAGYEVVGEAVDGRQAVELYRELQPDLVAMDLVMPEMNGIDAIREIRAQDPAARIIGLSALGQQKFVDQALAAGAVGFFSKPFDEERAFAAIREALAGEPPGSGTAG